MRESAPVRVGAGGGGEEGVGAAVGGRGGGVRRAGGVVQPAVDVVVRLRRELPR